MKRIYQYLIISLAVLMIGACAKEGLWNQNSEVPESEKGTIVGQLINDDDNQPLKGIKILFERQTKKDGSNTFVDTVSTDSEGKFSYQIPFPNKVRIVVRDTGRYEADTTFVEVLAHQNYPITMSSHPRFGVSKVNTILVDENQQPLAGLHVALSVRESNNEDYSLVENLLTDENGNVTFENIAFPVNYKVELIESPIAYKAVNVEGKLLRIDPITAKLQTEVLFGTTDVNFVSNAKKSSVQLTFTQLWNEEMKTINFTTDNSGNAVIQLPYPISGSISTLVYNGVTFSDVKTFQIDKASEKKIELQIKDKTSVKVSIAALGAASGTLYLGGNVNVYARELGSTNDSDFALLNTYAVDAQGYIHINDVEWPKELKLVPNYSDVNGKLGALDFVAPSAKIEVKDFNEVGGTFDMPYPNGYMLLGNGTVPTSARLKNEDLGIYNDPTIFGNNSQSGNQELTFQVKVWLNAKGANNPSIGGTVKNYSLNNSTTGASADGFGFGHSGHSGTPTWRFRYGQRVITTNGSDAEVKIGEWTTLTAVIRYEGGERRVYLYTNGIHMTSLTGPGTNTAWTNYAPLGSSQTGVVNTAVDMIFGNGPGQFGGGNMNNYIKDFRIYTRALSNTEIQNSCHDFLSPEQVSADPALIGYWPMNDGYTGSFKNYSKNSRASGKDMKIDAPKTISNIARKCN